LYSKLKNLYEEQHKCKSGSRGGKNSIQNHNHHSNTEKKSLIIINNEEEDQSQIISSLKKLSKHSDKIYIGKLNKLQSLNSDNNSNSSCNALNLNEYKVNLIPVKEGSNSNPKKVAMPEEVEPKFKNSTPLFNSKGMASKILNLGNTISLSPNSISRTRSIVSSSSSVTASLNVSGNASNFNNTISSNLSPVKKTPVMSTTTFNSNLFQNNILSSNLAANNIMTPLPLLNHDCSRRYTSLLNHNFHFDSLINFEYIKNFTTLDFKDLVREELIYSADICKVYKGRYLYLPVAIKVYNISKLKDEDLVNKSN
jgi:hypothetical protein